MLANGGAAASTASPRPAWAGQHIARFTPNARLPTLRARRWHKSAKSALSGALGDLIDVVGYQAVRLFVDASRGLSIRRLDQAEDLPSLVVDPVALVLHAILTLLGHV